MLIFLDSCDIVKADFKKHYEISNNEIDKKKLYRFSDGQIAAGKKAGEEVSRQDQRRRDVREPV